MKECPACRRCFPDDVNHCPHDGDATTLSIGGEPMLDGRYQLEKRLGHGGMGVVFKARHIFLKTQHAIKVILPDLVGNDPMLTTRFRQEALAAASIRHQNIIAVTDFGVARGTMPFLVMEFVKGVSLQDILASEGSLPPAKALELMSAIGAGIAAAHRQNIVHRDLKPLNIMIQEGLPLSEAVKVLDFGLAKIKSGELLGSFVQAKTSGLMGSPFYMAPEQWSDEEPDVRADIYSLGVILYQMLAGDVPFKGTSIPSIMKKHLTEPPPVFMTMGVTVPPAVEAVVRHALEKDPSNRTQTVELFIRELRDAVSSTSQSLDKTQMGVPFPSAEGASFPSMQSMPPPSSAEASLVVHTSPAQSRVFINNVYVGTSDASGNLTISSIRQGAHQLRVIQNGYAEWESQIQCTPPSSRADVVLRSLLGAGSPEASGDHLAGTISESSMARMPKEPSYATMEAARLRAQAEALDQQARQEADDQRREQERYEQERRDRLAREELAREEELKIQAQEEKKQAEAEARRKSEEEAARLRADAESARERAETETLARQKAEEEVARHRAEAEAARQRAEVEAEARRRAEEDSARWHAEEEAKKVAEASEAKRRAEQERLRREDEERKRIEIEAKLKHEQAQREELERAVLAAAERERQARDQMSLASVLAQGGTVQSPRVDLESTADQERAAATQSVGMASHPTIDQQKTWQQNQSSVHRSMPPGVAAKKKPAVAVLLVLVGVFIVAIAGGGFAVYKFVIAPGPAPTPKPGPVKPTPSPEASVKKPVADMVSIPGGTFKMGLDDGPAQSQPAHSVSVSPFSIDRTEVTNAEYAEFVKQDNYPAPADWVDGKPKAGQERWPIASISQEDAKAFAGWRTKRDGVSYRLPTEEEWEYAARGGDQELLYPWGNDWLDNRAVIGVLLEPRAVGSLPNGKSRWGVVDMIGNVWEWTSTTVTMYADSPYVLKKEHASWVIFRGGSYASNPNDPEKPITNAYRNWVPASTKDPTLGFRLVRDGN